MDRSGRGPADAAPHAHVVGIGGRGMAGLAQSLAQRGMTVTGSEVVPGTALEKWRKVGAGVRGADVPRAFSVKTRLLVHGPEIRREHPARLGALRRGIRQETPARWLREQTRGRVGVVVAGGREAGVAAAMTGWVLTFAGMDPAVLLGTPAPQLGGWARGGSGPHLVAEWAGGADGLGEIGPDVALLLNVGSDPWVDRDRWAGAFRRFLAAVPDAETVLALGHPSFLKGGAGVDRGPGRFEWVSLQRGGEWWGADLREESGRFRFRIFHRGRYVIEVRLQVAGLRNVLGALSAVAACDRLGLPAATIRQGLEEFTGLSRDFESLGSFRGVTLVDDEAGDAASIQEALAIARDSFGGRRLWAVCSAPAAPPGPVECRRFLSAVAVADRVLIVEVVPAAGRTSPVVCAGRPLTRALIAAGRQARRVSGPAGAISELDRHLEPGDVLLTLGAGDVGTIADALLRRLPRDRQDG